MATGNAITKKQSILMGLLDGHATVSKAVRKLGMQEVIDRLQSHSGYLDQQIAKGVSHLGRLLRENKKINDQLIYNPRRMSIKNKLKVLDDIDLIKSQIAEISVVKYGFELDRKYIQKLIEKLKASQQAGKDRHRTVIITREENRPFIRG